jgi:organic hydroperoxide reductase OsmC/OhrA
MNILARVQNEEGRHQASVSTDGNVQTLVIPPKATGFGSGVNGGELLFLALATCYCNDIYREAAKRGIRVESVTVEVSGQFGAAGEPAAGVSYRARIAAAASEDDIRELALATDRVAEIQNTLRVVTPVTLGEVEVVALV